MKKIKGQVIYMGPPIPGIGLQYGAIFRDGIHESFYHWIKQCPSIGQLFVPVAQCAEVRKQLAFDLGRVMRGTAGIYVAFYQAVQIWLADRTKEPTTPTTKGVKLTTHA